MFPRLQLRVTLLESEPEIWRRLLVDERLTLEQLHTVIQIAIGWQNSHLHRFESESGVAYMVPSRYDGEFPSRSVDERKVQLAEVLGHPGAAMLYEYDFGDGWAHRIEVEAIVDGETFEYPRETWVKAGRGVFSGKVRAAVCVAGERNGPPEDCGGVFRLAHLLSLLGASAAAAPGAKSASEPSRPRTRLSRDDRDFLEWAAGWEPDAFSISDVNQALGRVRVKKRFLSGPSADPQ